MEAVCVVVIYVPLNKDVGYSCSHIPPIVCAEDFDLSPKLILYKFFEVFEMLKNFKLLPEKIIQSVSHGVFN